MRIAILFFLLLTTGCSNLSDARGRLIDSTRTGVADVKSSVQSRAGVIDGYRQQKRARLDAAFDADLTAAEAAGKLDAKYVTDSRKAYALGVDALAIQQRAADRATAVDVANLNAIDAALSQLKTLDELDRRWLTALKPAAEKVLASSPGSLSPGAPARDEAPKGTADEED